MFTQLQFCSSLYKIFTHNTFPTKCIFLVGKNQICNDYIITNASKILNELFGITTTPTKLIWLHANGPSPHFILYCVNNIKINSSEIEIFTKNLCPAKANKSLPLDTCYLSDVMKTNTPGLVFLGKKYKLNDLLNNL